MQFDFPSASPAALCGGLGRYCWPKENFIKVLYQLRAEHFGVVGMLGAGAGGAFLVVASAPTRGC